jgi:hypothetical protein
MLDSGVVTAAAKTVLDDTTTAAMLTTLGALAKAGGTMLGDLVIDDSVAKITAGAGGNLRLNAPTGQNVRLQINNATRLAVNDTTAVFSTSVFLNNDPASGTEAATKQYVDNTAAPLNQTLNAQTGTTYTFVLGDNGKLVTGNNGSAITFTVPPNSSVAFPVGARIDIAGIGVGIITVAQGSGVTVNATPSLALRARYSGATLVKLATDTWLLVGDLA